MSLNVDNAVFETVMAGVLVPTRYGPLRLSKILPAVVIGIDTKGVQRRFRMMADVMLGTPKQLDVEFGRKIHRACSAALDGIESDPAQLELFNKQQKDFP